MLPQLLPEKREDSKTENSFTRGNITDASSKWRLWCPFHLYTALSWQSLRTSRLTNRRIMPNVYLFILLFMVLPPPILAQQQKFRVTPYDLQVLEGAEAMMRCEVSNKAGAVQWTKDGFALGFSAVIPGFPRYSVLGDRNQGVYNLRISNASITDDAEYQCQVGPARLHSAIRANAKLTVIAPPGYIEIQGYTQNSKVEVRENQDLSLSCVVGNAKPAAQIIWFRGNVEYKEGRVDKIEETSSKRYTTKSTLNIKPSADDDFMEYTCQAKHKALPPDMPLRSTVQLSVLYPPGPPYIEGYTQGEILRRGQTVELVCRSRGGNPPAQLIWYKNGSQIRMAYRTAGRLSENIYTFTAEASDNNARFRCEASNVMSQNPLKAEIDITVLFAPTHVSIAGPTEARVGDVVSLTCTTAPSNPPAEIKWMVGGRQIRNATSKTNVSSEGGWVTVSNITTTVEANKRSLVVICHGLNMQLTENVVSTHTVNILYPPSSPIISGYMEGQIIPAGSVQKLLCVSSGGNPLATLTWYKNDKRVNSVIRTADKSVSAEITILANVTDNQAQYRCEASNSATEIPLFESTILSVHFAPEIVKIRVEPEVLKPGMEVAIICDSSSSNPPAKLTWWKDGIPIDGINNSSKPGLWGGTVSTLEFKVNVSQEMNGVVYTCQSANEALQRSVHEAVNLNILYPPVFLPPPSSTAVGVEGESLQVSLSATANPVTVLYSWTKDGLPVPSTSVSNGRAEHRIYADGANLNFTKLNRNDAGIYVCEASNSEGSAKLNITIVVEYGTTIKAISENIVVNPGEDAMLSCTVEGKPLTEEHIKWERVAYDMTVKTTTSFVNNTSYLHIKDARREDVGNFRCIADNRVANPTNRDVLLIVKFPPEIDKSPTLLRAASGTGERGRLPCRAQAAPKPKFTWRQEGKDLQMNRTYKYEVDEKKIDSLTYESTLIIEKVAPADYGAYECVATNELGQTTELIRLDITSQPDTPLSLNILNITHDSVSLAWTPGFDGGLKASYRVRYREANREQYKYIDSLPNSHKLTISGLKTNTLYLFSVMAFNDLGNSKYLPDLQRAQTKEAPPPSQPASSLGGPPTTTSTPLGGTSGLLLLVGVVSGVTVVLLNVFIIGCCLHKRNQKRLKRGLEISTEELTEDSSTPSLVILGISMSAFGFLIVNAALVAWFFVHNRRKKAENDNQPGKTATIEMYAPSSYNDTVTGETLSSVSEKSESYSNDGSQIEYTDEARKKAASTYLVESSDMPPPRYQKDGTMPIVYPTNIVNARTLPHPRHHSNVTNILDHRAHDDQILINKGVYIPSPSPAPPPDGSYYNMNSDRYLSYPPMDYPPQLDFASPSLPMAHLQPITQASIISGNAMIGSGSGTLRRGIMRGVMGMPPPDVTQLTNTSLTGASNIQLLHELHPINISNNSCSTQTTSITGNGSMMSTIPSSTSKQPQSILKDPNRSKPQQQLLSANLVGVGVPTASGSLQILNIPTSAGISGNLLMTASGTYDPANLSTFNAATGTTLAYTDADGHLV
ncbi:nephrin isoform X1 [Bactrocera dorsalis]|uniref:Nephrin isoform X1 n=1 Tax=Bactrocera dorsalis TaxID=27457 RepID=A0ABM3JD65_BACDO|nr:nephrin isoform X1 [Bactrocera dorsalis]XP_049307144.1 nephrin isoform X1 [Bactrocera dorsalis]XP_049307145.1 nephrin isoform X1 [Bactrocera dorsalis]XP_049307146.1 nephrin isoform X1 [Bactrocera dorsalis]XP_049307147.1 nephrin isoform X1 [Bactrocera dorsalis]XP_049307148.1 nephrin isoform X1 [Bactrocera dorsalis]XP_049307149.1 nephrin isoform X1 [Bactrocera dorsalis]XP_049307150.1 nephrin isoform X1 [Bactrocera dorsalis]XP_049307151.1 nephrin isoform X1 [Bactrocera dorsalis]